MTGDFSVHIYCQRIKSVLETPKIGGFDPNPHIPDDGKFHTAHIARTEGALRCWVDNRCVFDESRGLVEIAEHRRKILERAEKLHG